MNNEHRRLFFGLEIASLWPTSWPKGRVLKEKDRHLTLTFLGNILVSDVQKKLSSIPVPSSIIGPSGFFDKTLFLPEKEPRVVAWEVKWLQSDVLHLQQQLANWMQGSSNEEKFLSHVTVCRGPFDPNEWTSFFKKLPCYAKALHLYQSLEKSTYESLWSLPFIPPFEEIHHTADIAFKIHGANLHQIYQNALIALAFKDPNLLECLDEQEDFSSLDEIIIALNKIICKADSITGCPFKAVSFHGEIQTSKEELCWEMVVDV